MLSLGCDESLQVGGLLSIIFILSIILILIPFYLFFCSGAGRGGGAFESYAVTEEVVPERQSLVGLFESFVFHFTFVISFVIISKQIVSLLF